MRKLDLFPTFQRLPIVPLWLYQTISLLCGGYPERALLRLSSISLRLPIPRSHVIKYWAEYYPYRTPASICEMTAWWLWACLENVQPRLVVEFGTGFSTLMMAAYAKQRLRETGRRVFILSAEHDKEWFDTQSAVLSATGLSDQVALLYAPLKMQVFCGKQTVCYSGVDEALDHSGLDPKADFVFVDGPPGLQIGGPGRFGSIAEAVSLTRPGGTILVHDALRKDEYSAIKMFHSSRVLGFECMGIVPLWYGLAVCKVSACS